MSIEMNFFEEMLNEEYNECEENDFFTSDNSEIFDNIEFQQ